MLERTFHRVPNGAGFDLALVQSWQPSRLVRGRAPVLIVPGYGMNSFIFGFHPSGLSFESFLTEAGFEVWRADLRGQGASVCTGGSDVYGLEDLAAVDLGAVLAAALDRTRTGADRVDLIGCSLGGTITFLHAALAREPRIAKIVAMGSPVRWVHIHPLVRAAFFSERLVGAIPVRGSRALLQTVLPAVARIAPSLLRVYLHPEIVDIRAAREMARTVEDPNRHVNRQIAAWIRRRDLIVGSTNLSDALGRMTQPLLVVVANGDGIVPRATAEFPLIASGASLKSRLDVGTAEVTMAHADMFVSSEAQSRVFEPIAAWLADPTDERGRVRPFVPPA